MLQIIYESESDPILLCSLLKRRLDAGFILFGNPLPFTNPTTGKAEILAFLMRRDPNAYNAYFSHEVSEELLNPPKPFMPWGFGYMAHGGGFTITHLFERRSDLMKTPPPTTPEEDAGLGTGPEDDVRTLFYRDGPNGPWEPAGYWDARLRVWKFALAHGPAIPPQQA